MKRNLKTLTFLKYLFKNMIISLLLLLGHKGMKFRNRNDECIVILNNLLCIFTQTHVNDIFLSH